jgi:hypothetical protein
MRFLLHPIKRSPVAQATGKNVGGDMFTQKYQAVMTSNATLRSKSECSAALSSANEDFKRSWGQQYSPDCGCVVRFEATVDSATQRILDAGYHAKTVLAISDKDSGAQLTPMYTTRNHRPMFQECKCDTVHVLSKQVTSYLQNKRLDQIRSMNEFTSTRSSLAFRHTVLAKHDLPRHHTHCFDVVEEAFTGMVNNTIPGRRIINADYQMTLRAEYLEQPLAVLSDYRGRLGEEGNGTHDEDYVRPKSPIASLGADRNRLSMSSPRTMTTLRMFDINAEHWDEVEHRESVNQSRQDQFDWVSYVDEQYDSKKSA